MTMATLSVKKTAGVLLLSTPVMALLLCSMVYSYQYVGRPFIGFLMFPNLLISTFYAPWWLAPKEGVLYPWVLDSIDSKPLRSASDLDGSLSSMNPGEIHLVALKSGNEKMSKGLPVVVFRLSDYLGVCGPMLVSGFLTIVIGILVGILLPGSPAVWSVLFFCLSLGGFVGTAPDWSVSHRIPLILLLFSTMTPASAMDLALFFPSPLPGVRWYHGLIPVGIGLFISLMFLMSLPYPETYAKVDTINGIFIGLSWIAYAGRLVGLGRSLPDKKDREIARISLLGGITPFAFALLPVLITIFIFHTPYALYAFSLLFTVFPPAAMAWALWRASLS